MIKRLGRNRIVYKKAWYPDDSGCPENVIVVLKLVKGVLYNHCTGLYPNARKCRAARATVLRFESLSGAKLPDKTKVYSGFNSRFKYVVGTVVRPTRDFNITDQQCESGIHFFFKRKDARNY